MEESFERVDEPTPNGGIYSIAFFRDDHGKPVPKNQATQCEIVEYDGNDEAIQRTYGVIEKV
jgi:hypothetical protein